MFWCLDKPRVCVNNLKVFKIVIIYVHLHLNLETWATKMIADYYFLVMRSFWVGSGIYLDN